ncbi:MAG TPA: XRE family transcriptional regulator, partial [Roseiflexaceae bacterium]|nr:XRE family transcriptional regulator [Roseiflexaceae bacterium]
MMSHPVRLPTYLTSFIGREREQEAVLLLLHSVRLLTLLGPGGSGKTRLAAEVVRCTDAFPDGVWFVRLADVADPQLVLSTIAHALAVPLGGAVASLDALAAWIADQRILLALDNLEQVAGAAPQLAQLLVAAPRLTILVTSRAALHVAGEQLFPLSPLPVPASVDPRVIAQNQAVQLFVARARAVRPDFSLTPNAALDVAAICRRLDGLPLAIELAAARIRLLPPTLLRKRL